MTTIKPTSKPESVFAKLIQPLANLIQQCDSKRDCKVLTDQDWLETGILRTISQEPSGRAFLQKLFVSSRSDLQRSHFFETLKSKRRLKLCQEVSTTLYKNIKKNNRQSDPFRFFAELDEYDIYAGDGHYHGAAAHDTKKEGKKYPVQHFYSTDLRTHGLSHLTLADTSGVRKREHDMHALKRLSLETLRQGAPKGRKVLYIWDRAGIDFSQWYKWKQTGGIYFISREKTNMRLLKLADLDFDRSDTVNKGVQSYELVGSTAGISQYRIKYKCPLTGKTYSFVTNLSKVSPGLVAYLYKTRWDIEKIFEQVKIKLLENKAWATSNTAKSMQAQFICLTHNLMLILEKHLNQEGIENRIEDNRRNKRLSKTLSQNNFIKEDLPVFLSTSKRATQRSVKFIRWLRNSLDTNTSWRDALGPLRRIYAVF